MRKVSGIKKIGHAGTLDPNATGLMLLGITRESTKKLHDITTGFNKTYRAEITLGEDRDTYDAEGIVTKTNKEIVPKIEEVEKAVASFLGKQQQIPPIHSAIKIKGKKAYDIARSGKSIEMEPRSIEIFNINIVSYDYPVLVLDVEVSAGTYIRSIANDLGLKLATGAYLSNLSRTRIGKMRIEDSVEMEDITKDNWENYLINI